MLSEIQHQKEATRFLQRVGSGQLQLPLLLVGPPGVGKRFSVLCLMRELLCTGTRVASCPCAACYQIKRALHSDIHLLAAEKHFDVAQARSLVSQASECPSVSSFCAFIVDGADRFTPEAADALLKVVEEPPRLARFFLLAEELSRVPAPIRSRCGLIVYRPLPAEFIASIVQRYEPDASKALVYSRLSDGSLGRAIDYCNGGKLALRDHVVKVLRALVARNLVETFSLVDTMKNDLDVGADFMERVVHDVLVASLDPMRVVNLDIVDTLAELQSAAPVATWIGLAGKLRTMRLVGRRAALNVSFHLKTALAETIVAVE